MLNKYEEIRHKFAALSMQVPQPTYKLEQLYLQCEMWARKLEFRSNYTYDGSKITAGHFWELRDQIHKFIITPVLVDLKK